MRYASIISIFVAICVATTTGINAQTSDSAIRVNPEISGNLEQQESPSDIYFNQYPFLNKQSNVIQMNGADWGRLRQKIANSGTERVSILYLGDSHVQAEGGTTVTRNMLQSKYGYAGRGLITPFRLAGTNQPVDYVIKSNKNHIGARLLKLPWPVQPGFTGIGVDLAPGESIIEVGNSERNEKPFCFNTVSFYLSDAKNIRIVPIDSTIPPNSFNNTTENNIVTINFDRQLTTVRFAIFARQNVVLSGINLYEHNDVDNDTGLLYHAIGNNGATFGTYNMLPNFAADVSTLHPDLIIVALGCNEAFNNITDNEMTQSIDYLMNNLRKDNPEAEFILVTPAECHKSVTKTSKKKRKGRRSKKQAIKHFVVNTDIKRMRDLIMDYAESHRIPTYDWYEVAGGDGASYKWIDNSLLNRDHIHCTWDGYRVQGSLFFDALQQSFDTPNKD